MPGNRTAGGVFIGQEPPTSTTASAKACGPPAAGCVPGDLDQSRAEEEHHPRIVRRAGLSVDSQAQYVAVEAAAAVQVGRAQKDPPAQNVHATNFSNTLSDGAGQGEQRTTCAVSACIEQNRRGRLQAAATADRYLAVHDVEALISRSTAGRAPQCGQVRAGAGSHPAPGLPARRSDAGAAGRHPDPPGQASGKRPRQHRLGALHTAPARGPASRHA